MLASRFSASCHGCEGTLAQTHERRPSRENRTPFGDTLKAKGESPMHKVPRRRHHRSVDVLTEHLRASAKLGYTPGEESSRVYLARSEGGGCGIRTHERLAPLAFFKTAAIGH